jgi:hypothetical protein
MRTTPVRNVEQEPRRLIEEREVKVMPPALKDDDFLPRLGRTADEGQDNQQPTDKVITIHERERKPVLYLPNGKPLYRRLGF